MLQRKPFALLVSDGDESFESLKALLKSGGMEVWNSRTRGEATRLLDQTHPELIFTATHLIDGSWMDIVNVADKAPVATNVIVVGRCKDVQLYLATIDQGAFDFVLPPFEVDPISHVVRVASEDVRRRREAQSFSAVA